MPVISRSLFFKLTSIIVILSLILIDLPLYAFPLKKDDRDYTPERKLSVSDGYNTQSIDYLMEATGSRHPQSKLAESEIQRNAQVRITAEGLLESGMPDEEAVKILIRISSPDEAVMALRKCGKDVCWIAGAFEKAGYSREEIANVLPVDAEAKSGIEPRYAGTIFAPISFNNSVTQSNTSVPQIKDLSVSEDIPLKQETLKTEAAEELPRNSQAAVKEDRISCSQALKHMEEEQGAGVNIAQELYKAGYSKAELVSAYIEKAVGWVKEKGYLLFY